MIQNACVYHLNTLYEITLTLILLVLDSQLPLRKYARLIDTPNHKNLVGLFLD